MSLQGDAFPQFRKTMTWKIYGACKILPLRSKIMLMLQNTNDSWNGSATMKNRAIAADCCSERRPLNNSRTGHSRALLMSPPRGNRALSRQVRPTDLLDNQRALNNL